MTSTLGAPADLSVTTDAGESFDSLDPATGAVLTSWPVHSDEQVQAAVTRGHTAAAWWADLGFDGRKTHLAAWRGEIARRMPELAKVVHEENGKPFPDAVLEITLAVDHIKWAAAHAEKVLGPRKVKSGAMAANQASTLEYPPMGVIGVIGPWNYPVFTPMGSLAYAPVRWQRGRVQAQ